jgi:hypothetical protein
LFVHARDLFLEAIGDGWPWGRWLQWFQRMTMSKGTGPSKIISPARRQCN